jgi:hypothetical protein
VCGRRQCALPLRASFVLSQVFEVNSVVTGGGCLLFFVFWEELDEEDIETEETENYCCCF